MRRLRHVHRPEGAGRIGARGMAGAAVGAGRDRECAAGASTASLGVKLLYQVSAVAPPWHCPQLLRDAGMQDRICGERRVVRRRRRVADRAGLIAPDSACDPWAACCCSSWPWCGRGCSHSAPPCVPWCDRPAVLARRGWPRPCRTTNPPRDRCCSSWARRHAWPASCSSARRCRPRSVLDEWQELQSVPARYGMCAGASTASLGV